MNKYGNKYFLAANSCDGFVSFFENAYNPRNNWRAFIIKGGPGTGKSSFMKEIARIGEEKGYCCERGFCSSDPDSLDAVIFPQLRVAVMDGTAPHLMDPVYPGVSETILNFSDFWKENSLQQNSKEIIEITDKNKIGF